MFDLSPDKVRRVKFSKFITVDRTMLDGLCHSVLMLNDYYSYDKTIHGHHCQTVREGKLTYLECIECLTGASEGMWGQNNGSDNRT